MAPRKPVAGKKYYTVAEANAALPLVRVIVRDIAQLFPGLSERYERLRRILPGDADAIHPTHQEEVEQVQAEFDRDNDKLNEFIEELMKLGIELKDPARGLIDFPCWMNNHEVYLCWLMGEPEVAHWHELDAGFAGRQQIPPSENRGRKSEARS